MFSPKLQGIGSYSLNECAQNKSSAFTAELLCQPMPCLALPSTPPTFRFQALAWKATLYSRAEIPSPQRHLFARPGRRAKLPETAGKFQAFIIIAQSPMWSFSWVLCGHDVHATSLLIAFIASLTSEYWAGDFYLACLLLVFSGQGSSLSPFPPTFCYD